MAARPSPMSTASAPSAREESSIRRLSIQIDKQELPCTAREAQLYFLMGFKPVDRKSLKPAGVLLGLG